MNQPESTAEERWLPIADWEGFYEVSDRGRVRSIPRTSTSASGVRRYSRYQVLAQGWHLDGHKNVTLSRGGNVTRKSVHRLVLEAFVGPPPREDLWCCHINGVPADNRPENLYWGTASDNAKDSVRHGTNHHSRKTRCAPHGHPLEGENLRINCRGQRVCRACSNAQSRESQRRAKQSRAVSHAAVLDGMLPGGTK